MKSVAELRSTEELRVDNTFAAWFYGPYAMLHLKRSGKARSFALDVDEALALRDWLNKALAEP